jgi:hypothetical protein
VRGRYRLGFLLLFLFLVLVVEGLDGALLQLRVFVLGDEVGFVLLERGVDAALDVVVEGLLGSDVAQQLRLGRIQIRIKPFFEGVDVFDLEIVEVALGSGEQDDDLLFSGEWMELRLLEQFAQALAAVELVLRDFVEVAAELGEGGQFPVLGEIKLEGRTDLLDGLDGGGESYAGRWPELKRSVSRKICPSVMEITLVGM